MQEPVLNTLLYKYNPYARFLVVLYILGIFVFYLVACELIPMYIIWMVLCIWAIPLVYAGISKRSIFNFRGINKHLLSLSPHYIKVGRDRFPIKDSRLQLEVNAYDGFVYRIRSEGLLTPQTTYGVNNMLLVTYKGITHDYEFHLRDYTDYTILCELIDAWRTAGAAITVKEKFTREFVHKQHARLLRLQQKRRR